MQSYRILYANARLSKNKVPPHDRAKRVFYFVKNSFKLKKYEIKDRVLIPTLPLVHFLPDLDSSILPVLLPEVYFPLAVEKILLHAPF